MRWNGGGIAAVAIAMTMMVPGAAGAAPTWRAPAVLVQGDGAGLIGGMVRADGSPRIAVWDESEQDELGFVDTLGAPPLTVLTGTGFAYGAGFAADGSGLALTGARGSRTTSVVAFAADGTPNPAPLLQLTGRSPELAVARTGAAVVAWAAKGGKGAEIDAAFREPGAAGFGPVQRAGYATTSDAIVHAGIGDDGTAVVSWQANYFPSPLAAAVRPAHAGFAPARFVSRSAVDGQLAVGPGGQAILTAPHPRSLGVSLKAPGATAMSLERVADRSRRDGGIAEGVAAAGTRGVGVAWMAGARVHVLTGAADPGRGLHLIGALGRRPGGEYMKLALAPSGAALVAWEEALKAKRGNPTARSHLAVAVRPAGRRFAATAFLGPVSLDATPELALLQGDRAYVAYEAFQPDTHGYRRVYASRLRVGTTGAAAARTARAARTTTWSPTKSYDKPPASCAQHGYAGSCVVEPAPRAAVNARGAAVVAWVDSTRGGYRVRAATAPAGGGFGAAVTVAAKGLRPATAVAPDGAVTVVWAVAHGKGEDLWFARRAAGARHFGRARLLTRGGDMAHAAAEPDGAVEVVYEAESHGVRTVEITARGVVRNMFALGPGYLDHDSVRAAADGTLAACCVAPVNGDPNVPADTATKVGVYRHDGGWALVSATGFGRDDAIETVFANGTDLLTGVLEVHEGGDAGALGVPGIGRVGGLGPLAAPLLVPGVRPSRGLSPVVAIDGSGRSVLVYQEKDGSKAFSRVAPVYASVAAAGAPALPAGRRLDASEAYQPAVRPFGDGALAVWRNGRGRWGVAIERDGRFRTAPAPSGAGPSSTGEDFSYNNDLATNGAHAVLAWTARDGTIHVSALTATRG
jgi:hypothetical protein